MYSTQVRNLAIVGGVRGWAATTCPEEPSLEKKKRSTHASTILILIVLPVQEPDVPPYNELIPVTDIQNGILV